MKRVALLTLFISITVSCVYAQNWDINTLHKINNWDGKFIRNYNRTISRTEPYIAVGVPTSMLVLALVNNNKALLEDAIYTSTSVVGTFAITYGMKYLINRKRPYDRYPEKVYAYSHESSPSFPSGHTATAFALATSLCIKYPKWYIIAPTAAWACSVGISRMNEGVHYPSDVIAGAVIGAGCAVLNIYVNRWLNKALLGN
jgi:membrane-associated phospholipid phosphatase